jgi:hypothetical protein
MIFSERTKFFKLEMSVKIALTPRERYAVALPKSERARLTKMQAARAAIRLDLGNRCSNCGATPKPIRVLRRTRKGHRSTRSHVEVSQLHGHHIVPGAPGDHYDYIAHAKQLPPAIESSSDVAQHDSNMPTLELLCVGCHKEVHAKSL